MKNIKALDYRELATTLAALRYYQHDLALDVVPARFRDISDDGGTIATPLSVEEIDALCEELNE